MLHETKGKTVLTTGEVARICQVAPLTVSKWVDNGALPGYRIPGSRDRRIPVNHLIRFMRVHGMPLNGLVSGITRVLIVDEELESVEVLQKVLTEEGAHEVRIARSGFAAGVTTEKFRPHVILLDMHLHDVDSRELCKQVKGDAELLLTRIIGMSAKFTPEESRGLSATGFDGFLRKPFRIREAVESIQGVMRDIY